MNAIRIPTQPARASAAAAEPPPGLLVNPRSFSVVSGGLAARAIALARARGADVIEADGPASIGEGIDRALGRGMRRLFVLAGDGTIQAIADHLAALPAGSTAPELLLLAGGRTNLTPADLGGAGRVLAKLESAFARAARDPQGGLARQYRHVLVIEQPPAAPRHGFFVAGALVDRVLRDCHRHRASARGLLRNGRLGDLRCALKGLPALLAGTPRNCPTLDVELACQGRLSGPSRLLIATTLVHERGWFNPYAERGEGALRVTAVTAAARRFRRSLLRLLTGRYSPAMTVGEGYLSGRSDTAVVTGLDGYTLDGQSFPADPARAVTIRTGPRLTFLVP